MDDIAKIINDYKPDNKKITNDTYISRIKKLFENEVNLENPKTVAEYVSKLAFKTARSYYIAIIVYLKALGKTTEVYDNIVKTMGSKIEEDDSLNKKNPKEEANMVTREEIENILKNIENDLSKIEPKGIKYFRKLQDYLILNLYYLIPPIRNDYVSVLVYKTLPKKMNNEENYIVIKNKKMYLNAYKTDKKYGQIIIPVPKKIIDLINKLFDFRQKEFPKLSRNRRLLINSDLKPMSNVNLIQNLNSIFKKFVSVTILRKSYISEKYPVTKSVKEMKQDANIMGHSVELQQTTYRKK